VCFSFKQILRQRRDSVASTLKKKSSSNTTIPIDNKLIQFQTIFFFSSLQIRLAIIFVNFHDQRQNKS